MTYDVEWAQVYKPKITREKAVSYVPLAQIFMIFWYLTFHCQGGLILTKYKKLWIWIWNTVSELTDLRIFKLKTFFINRCLKNATFLFKLYMHYWGKFVFLLVVFSDVVEIL